MNNPSIEEVKTKVMELILTLDPKDQNTLVKDLFKNLSKIRYDNMKIAKDNLALTQNLYHDIYS